MKILFKNATVFTMNENFDILKNGVVAVDNQEIKYVGLDDLKHEKFDRVIDCCGDVIMPSFVNAHTHSAMTLFRGIADDMELQDWLFKCIFPMEDQLTEDDVYWGTQLATLEYVRGGITTFSDMYFYPHVVMSAVKASGLTCVSVSGATDFGGESKKTFEDEVNRFENLNGIIPNYNYMLGCHSEYTTTPELLELICDYAIERKQPLYAHASETLLEVGQCAQRHNDLSPIAYFHKIGFFENGATLAHCVHIDKDDRDILKQSNVNVVTNPASNLKLGSGTAPLHSMESVGINIAIGTDGAASNNSYDMFREMYLASVLQKGEMKNASAMQAENILKMATINGANALFKNNIGALKKGYLANIIRLNTKSPHFHPNLDSMTSSLVYSAKSSDVCLTMSRGKIVYENGNYFVGESVDDIYRKCGESIKRILTNKKK